MSTLNNSSLFKQAHKMTKLTIQPNDTYRYKFGQWLIFLKTGITNFIKPKSKRVNQSVSYVPLLEHDGMCKDNITNWLTFLYNILPIRLLLIIASIIVVYVNLYL